MPLGVAYAALGGLGIVPTAIIGAVVFEQRLDWIAIVGIGFIVAGVVIVNGFSKAGDHWQDFTIGRRLGIIVLAPRA